MVMDTKSQTGSSPNWLRWGQPVTEAEPLADGAKAENSNLNRHDRIDVPSLLEDRNQLRDRLLKMIVHAEQTRKAHRSRSHS